MARDGEMGMISRFLFRIGEALLFKPSSEFASMHAEKEAEEKDRKGFVAAHFAIAPEKRLKMKTALAKSYEQSFLLNLYRALLHRIFTSKIRSFGILIFTSGFLNALSYFSVRFLPALAGDVDHLFFGLCLILIGLIVSLDRHGVGEVLRRSFLFRKILHPVFGIEEWEIPAGPSREHIWGMLLGGVLLGVFSVLTSPFTMLGALFALISVCMILDKPETGLILSCILFLMLPEVHFSFFVLITLASLLFKTMIGKRSIRFSAPDAACLLAVLASLLSGALLDGAGAGINSVRLAGMIALFFLGAHLIRTLDMLKRVFAALTIALFLGSLSIVLNGTLSLLPQGAWLLPGGSEALLFFDVTKESGILLALLIPPALGLARSEARLFPKLFAFLTALLALVALGFVGSGMLWISCLAGILVFILLSYRGALYSYLVCGLLSYIGFTVMPPSALESLISFMGFDKWNFEATEAKWLLGAQHFSHAFPWGTGLSDASLANAAEAGSLYFEIGILGGAIGLILFYAILALFFWQSWRFARSTTRSDIHPLVLGACAGALVFLLLGFTTVCFDYKTLSLYFLFVSFPLAAQRCCYREEVRLPY